AGGALTTGRAPAKGIGMRLAAILAAAALGGCAPAPSPAPAGPPARIVSLAPSVTEVVYALGAGERLVGVCAQCDYPAAVASVPRVGGYLAPSVAVTLGRRPDLVIPVQSPRNSRAGRGQRGGGRGAGVADADARAGSRARPRGDRRRLHGERGRRPGALRRAHHRARGAERPRRHARRRDVPARRAARARGGGGARAGHPPRGVRGVSVRPPHLTAGRLAT